MSKIMHAHFLKYDPIMAKLAKTHAMKKSRRPTENRFEYLTLTILYQQLATKVAAVIADRFKKLYKGKNFPSPRRVLNTPDEILRGVGISWQKISYIKDLAKKTSSKHINIEALEQLTDEEVIMELTKVKGIGRWTAEMFLMSALARPDIFSFGDLGLQTAIKRAYGFKTLPSKRTMMRISKKWSPYRTHAARVLWASLDNE
jgi:DNA-3-methyladenine glycosylase II